MAPVCVITTPVLTPEQRIYEQVLAADRPFYVPDTFEVTVLNRGTLDLELSGYWVEYPTEQSVRGVEISLAPDSVTRACVETLWHPCFSSLPLYTSLFGNPVVRCAHVSCYQCAVALCHMLHHVSFLLSSRPFR